MRQFPFKTLGSSKVKMGIVTGQPVHIVVHKLLQASKFSLKKLTRHYSLIRTAIQISQRLKQRGNLSPNAFRSRNFHTFKLHALDESVCER